MRDTNLVNALRELAEWAQANEWETPITLCEALVGMGSNGEINIFYTTLSDQISFEQADIGKTVFLTREAAEKARRANG